MEEINTTTLMDWITFGIAVHNENRRYTDVVYHYSTAMPIQLSALESVSCIVLFEDIPEAVPLSATLLTFQISTNRGRIAKRKLELPQDWSDQKEIP